MELHQLKYLVAVAEHGNFTRAAAACSVSQPSLSQQIIKLEKEVGQQLIDRTRRTVSLTTAGEIFIAEARKILWMVDETLVRVNDPTAFSEGRISISAIPAIALFFYRAFFPAFRPSFRNRGSFLTRVIRQHSSRTVSAEKQTAVLPHCQSITTIWKRSRCFRRSCSRCCLLHEDHCLGDQIASIWHSNSKSPTVRCKSAQLATVKKLVSIGMGVSMMPEMAIKPDDGKQGLVYRPLAREKQTRTVALVLHNKRHRSRLTTKFIEFATTLADETPEFTMANSGVVSRRSKLPSLSHAAAEPDDAALAGLDRISDFPTQHIRARFVGFDDEFSRQRTF